MKAITKDQVKDNIKCRDFPDFVIQAFNEAIQENFRGSYSTFDQNKIMDKILSFRPDLNRQDVWDNKWMDVEEFYRKEGWKVTYTKGPYYDDTTPYFTFE